MLAVLARRARAPSGAAMTDKIDDCIAKIVAIGRGSGTLEQQLGQAERRIADLVSDTKTQVGGTYNVLEDLRDGLSQEFDLHHGLLKGFLEKVINFVDALLDE